MIALFRSRLTAIWLVLVAATCLSWGVAQGFATAANLHLITAGAMVIAFVKARLILLDFMELRRAPLPLRVFAEVWAVLVCAAILVMYFRSAG